MSADRTRWVNIANLVAPFLLRALRVPPSIIPLVIDALTEVEQTSLMPAGGARKKLVVLGAVKDGIALLNQARGRTVVDAPAIIALLDPVIDIVIASINDVHTANERGEPPPSHGGAL